MWSDNDSDSDESPKQLYINRNDVIELTSHIFSRFRENDGGTSTEEPGMFDARAFAERMLAEQSEMRLLGKACSSKRFNVNLASERYFGSIDRHVRIGLISALSLIEPLLQSMLSAIHSNGKRSDLNVQRSINECMAIRPRTIVSHEYMVSYDLIANADNIERTVDKIARKMCTPKFSQIFNDPQLIKYRGNFLEIGVPAAILTDHNLPAEEFVNLALSRTGLIIEYIGITANQIHVFRVVNRNVNVTQVISMMRNEQIARSYYQYSIATHAISDSIKSITSVPGSDGTIVEIKWKHNAPTNTYHLLESLIKIVGQSKFLAANRLHNNFCDSAMFNMTETAINEALKLPIANYYLLTMNGPTGCVRITSDNLDNRHFRTNEPLANDPAEYSRNFIGAIIQNSLALYSVAKSPQGAHLGAINTRHVTPHQVRGQTSSSTANELMGKLTNFRKVFSTWINSKADGEFNKLFETMVGNPTIDE